MAVLIGHVNGSFEKLLKSFCQKFGRFLLNVRKNNWEYLFFTKSSFPSQNIHLDYSIFSVKVNWNSEISHLRTESKKLEFFQNQ